MAAPFYFLFLPLAVIIGAIVWILYGRLSHDSQSDLRDHRRSDLEKAQEMERQEEQTERMRGTSNIH